MKFTKILSCLLAVLFAVNTALVVLAAESGQDQEEVQASLSGRGFKETVDLGAGAFTAVVISGAFGEHDGRTYAYSTSNGGVFNVLDVESNRLVYSQQLEGVNRVWTHSIAPDGRVYIVGLGQGNVGELWIYHPDQKKAEPVGIFLDGHQTWSSTVDEAGNLYVGTYSTQGAHVVKYDMASKTMVDLGMPDAQSYYIRSIAYADNCVYLGMGVVPRLIKLDLATGQFSDVTGNLEQVLGKPLSDCQFVYSMSAVGDYLAMRVDDGGLEALVFYNWKTQQWSDKKLVKPDPATPEEKPTGVFAFNKLAVDGSNNTYVIFNRKLTRINLDTLEAEDTNIPYGGFLRGSWIYQKDGQEYFLTLTGGGAVCWMNPQQQTLETKDEQMVGAALQLHNLGRANNGKLYLTTYPGGPRGVEFDPVTGQFRSYSQGQAEGMVAGEGDIQYFGIYPHARIQQMNTATGEITELFSMAEQKQDRPYIMKYENGKLLVGTIPEYGVLGGAMAIYDVATGQQEVYPDIIQDQSIVGLASKDGILYGSTSISGGYGIEATADNAKLFGWDMQNKTLLFETELDIPDLKTPMISGLTFDKQGRLWGAANGILFTYDVESRKVTQYKNFYPEVTSYGVWRPVHIIFGDDGLLYTDLAGKLTVVDPSKEGWPFVTLPTEGAVNFMDLAVDGQGNQNIYMLTAGKPTQLQMVPVIDGGEVQPRPEQIERKIEVPNAGFEEFSTEGGELTVPGWKPFSAFSQERYYEISTEQVAEGERSLKVVDTTTQKDMFAMSEYIPLPQSAEQVKFSAKVYLPDGACSVLVRFWDKDHKRVGTDKEGENIIPLRTPMPEWQTAETVVELPEGAVYATVGVGVARAPMSSGVYFDDIRLSELVYCYPIEVQTPHLTASQEKAAPGDTVLLQPAEGYEWKQGSLAVEAEGQPVAVGEDLSFRMPAAAVTVRADMQPILYPLHYDLSGGVLDKPNPESYTIETESFVLHNPSREGYIFQGWIWEDQKEPMQQVTIEKGTVGARDFTAVWQQQAPEVTPTPAPTATPAPDNTPKPTDPPANNQSQPDASATGAAPATGDNMPVIALVLIGAAAASAVLWTVRRREF